MQKPQTQQSRDSIYCIMTTSHLYRPSNNRRSSCQMSTLPATNTRTRVASSLTGFSSALLAFSKASTSGPCGVIMECRLPPPGKNPSSCRQGNRRENAATQGRHRLQWNLSVKDTLNEGHLSNEDTVCSPNHRVAYKSASELGTPLYTGQPAGSQWCPP